MNAWLPCMVVQRFRQSNIVVFSSGNLYPKVSTASGGATERVRTVPVGEYCMSCLGRERAFEYAGHNSPQQYLLDFYTELFSSADFVNDSKCTYNNPTTSKEMYNVIARLESFAYVGIITEWVNDGMKTDYMAHLEELKALQKTWGTVIAS